jgi:hypothetical protein
MVREKDRPEQEEEEQVRQQQQQTTTEGEPAASSSSSSPPASRGLRAILSDWPYTPLPSTADLNERVLHAFTHAPQTAHEQVHGCSLLQVACALRVAEERVAEAVRQLVQQGKMHSTLDEQHFKPSAQTDRA